MKLSRIDENLKKSIEYGKGIRILNQDPSFASSMEEMPCFASSALI